jgi:hypothetical protein
MKHPTTLEEYATSPGNIAFEMSSQEHHHLHWMACKRLEALTEALGDKCHMCDFSSDDMGCLRPAKTKCKIQKAYCENGWSGDRPFLDTYKNLLNLGAIIMSLSAIERDAHDALLNPFTLQGIVETLRSIRGMAQTARMELEAHK